MCTFRKTASIVLLLMAGFAANVLAYPSHTLTKNQWSLISLPADPGESGTVENLLGDDLSADFYGTNAEGQWVMYAYDTSQGQYKKLNINDVLLPNTGYYIIQQLAESVEIDVPDTLKPLSGSSGAGCAEDKRCFAHPLVSTESGISWNLIGYSSEDSFIYGDSSFVATNSCENGCTPDNARSASVANNVLYRLNAEGDSFETVAASMEMRPWEAYWLAVFPGAESLNWVVPVQTVDTPEVDDPVDLAETPTKEESANFLMASTFGPTEDAIDELASIGYSNWIDSQLNMPINYMLPHISPNILDKTNYKWEGLARHEWYKRAVFGEDQLRQRAAFALSQIFVVSTEPRNWMFKAHLQARYMDIMQEGAFGNFRDLLEEVTYSPLMGLWLTYIGNQKANGETGSVPDENFAREILQLFTIGLEEIDDGGQPRLNSDGEPVETYDLNDIAGLSKVFTGLWWADRGGFGQANPAARNQRENFAETDPKRMEMYDSVHSPESKSFLGHTIPANTPGTESIKQALDVIFAHRNVGPFISRQLIQRLTTSNPSKGYVRRVTAVFNSGTFTLPDGQTIGSGTRGDLAPVWAAILLDQEARSPDRIDTENWGKVREPIIRFLHWARAAGVNSVKVTSVASMERGAPNRFISQDPFRSQTVFNFFRPGYVAAGTFTGEEELVAPELQITTTTTAIHYANFLRQFIIVDRGRHWVGSYNDQLARAADPAELTNYLDLTMTGGRMTDRTRQRVQETIASVENRRDRVQLGMLLVVNSQEYNTQQ